MSALKQKFSYGVCYYPEAWSESQRASDIDRIADCGFDYVRMGEGAWSYWEPKEGQFQFDLFDRVIDRCRKRGVRIILGTPTYASPAWVASDYPEVLRWNYNRIPMQHGSRRNLNYTSPKMLELSDRICTALAEHYAGESQVIGWQLDNEFNCHMDTSYAPSDTIAFRAWLRENYRTLDALNDSWGTKFWSQTYTAWDQIDLPHPTVTYHNPSALLDESRFISAMVVRFAKRQAAILRNKNPGWFITYNGLFGNVDGPKLAAELDFFCQDWYPLFWKHWSQAAETIVTGRSLSFPFGILEQQAGPGGQMDYLHRTPRSGEQRLWTYSSVTNGANLLSYFRWRTCPYGSEQHWHGLLDADDRDNRRIEEAQRTGVELKTLPADFFDAPLVRTVALLRDFDNEINDWRINKYIGNGRHDRGRWLGEFLRRHVAIDYVWPSSDFAGYGLMIVPHHKIVTAEQVAKLTAFVQDGGVLLLCAQCGLKDSNCHVVQKTPPGLFAELAGVTVEDWTTLPEDQTRLAILEGGESLHLANFVEHLKPTTAKVIAHWKEEDTLLLDSPAMTCNGVGKGTVYYLGGYCSDSAVALLAGWLIKSHELPRPVDAPVEVEVVIRQSASARYVCLLNHSAADQTAHGDVRGQELLSGKTADSHSLILPGYGVAIVQTIPT